MGWAFADVLPAALKVLVAFFAIVVATTSLLEDLKSPVELEREMGFQERRLVTRQCFRKMMGLLPRVLLLSLLPELVGSGRWRLRNILPHSPRRYTCHLESMPTSVAPHAQTGDATFRLSQPL